MRSVGGGVSQRTDGAALVLIAALRYIGTALTAADRKALFAEDRRCREQYIDILAHILRADGSAFRNTSSTGGLRHAAVCSLESFADADIATLLADNTSDLFGALLHAHSQSSEFSERIVILFTKALGAMGGSSGGFAERVREDSPFATVAAALAKHFAVAPPSFAAVWKSYDTPSYNLTCVEILRIVAHQVIDILRAERRTASAPPPPGVHGSRLAHANARPPLRLSATRLSGTRSTRCAFYTS